MNAYYMKRVRSKKSDQGGSSSIEANEGAMTTRGKRTKMLQLTAGLDTFNEIACRFSRLIIMLLKETVCL